MGPLEAVIAAESEEKRWSNNHRILKSSFSVEIILNSTLSLVFEICNQGGNCFMLRTPPLSIYPLLRHSFHTKGNCVEEKDYWRRSGPKSWILSCWLCATTRYSRINPPLMALKITLDLNPTFMHEWDFWPWWSANWDWPINMIFLEKWWLSKVWKLGWHFDL